MWRERSRRAEALDAAETFDVDDVLDLADALHDVLQLVEVVDLDHEVVQAPSVLRDRDLGLGDVAAPRGDRAGDLREQAGAILANVDRDLDGPLRRLAVLPLDGQEPLLVEDVLHDGQAVACMDGQSAPARDEADDAVARPRRTALAAPDPQIVHPAEADRTPGLPGKPLDLRLRGRLLLVDDGRRELAEHLL